MTQTTTLAIVWRNPKPPQRRQRWEQIKLASETTQYGPGTGFYLGRFVLDRYVKLGDHRWRSRCLALRSR